MDLKEPGNYDSDNDPSFFVDLAAAGAAGETIPLPTSSSRECMKKTEIPALAFSLYKVPNGDEGSLNNHRRNSSRQLPSPRLPPASMEMRKHSEELWQIVVVGGQ